MKKGRIEDLHSLYLERRTEIRRRLDEFRAVPPEEYFYEMVYCLLTPQTSARSAEMAVNVLRKHRFREKDLDPLPYLHSPRYYIRFHRTKAGRLVALKGAFPRIMYIIADETLDAAERRSRLVDAVEGYGLKEATHFLRNIGKNEGLAILDRHILRNLKRYGVIEIVPVTLTARQYYIHEDKFRSFSQKQDIPIDELDLLFWSMETGVILK
jgi:N-glycosylase/DNA lyase